MTDHSSPDPVETTGCASELDKIVEAFDQAWARGERSNIDDVVRTASGHVDQFALLDELVHLELEQRLSAGEPARVEDYVERYPRLLEEQAAVLDLIRLEFEMRRQREPGLAMAEYANRFPWCLELLPKQLTAPRRPRPGRVAVRLNCPHCQNPIEVVDDRQGVEDVLCPSCGSSFKLAADRTQSWKPDKLPRLGKFELLEVVGRGAFGTVYRAQDTELDRIVAVKLPRSGSLATQEDEDRFIREARSVAQLRHASIVSVFETGRSDQFPYIVSEFVEGVTLSDSLTGKRPSFRESAELMAKVAAALQYAHERGVIHRDVKPSNIMLDKAGQPHLMDFGLARRDAGEITMTMEGQVLGTPAYMSPEQARGEGHRVDGRSDVYSLGAILYELLTGELPFRGNTRMLLNQVLHHEPRNPRGLNDRIPRDLETVCLKAMAKEPGRRYQTARAMAEDLNRFLAGEPISARPVGRIERSWRWCRRNSAVATLAATVVFALISGTGVSSYFAIRSNTFALHADARAQEAVVERDRADRNAAAALNEKLRADEKASEAEASATRATEEAQRAIVEAEKARQVARFLGNMFEESAPLDIFGLRVRPDGHDTVNTNLTARQILDRGSQRVSGELQEQPLVQAALKETIGNVYLGLGLLEKAETLQLEALDLRKNNLPHEHLDLASSFHSIGVLRYAQIKEQECADAFRRALAMRRALLGEDHELVDNSRAALSFLLASYSFKPADRIEAVTLARDSLSWRRKHFGNAHRQTAFGMFLLGFSLLQSGEGPGEAAQLVQEAAPIFSKDPLTKPFGDMCSQFLQLAVLNGLGQRQAVFDMSRKAIASAGDVFGDGHPLMRQFWNYMHGFYRSNPDQLMDLRRYWLERLRGRHGAASPIYATGILNLAEALTSTGKLQDLNEAESLCREWLDQSRQPAPEPSAVDSDLAEVLRYVLKKKSETSNNAKDSK